MEDYGIQQNANPGRDLYAEYNGKKYARLPVISPFIEIGQDLNPIIEKHVKPFLKKGDLLCISAKVISISRNFVVHESKVKVTWLAKFIVKFVTKWPDDIGYSHPRKMQVAIDKVGHLRIFAAIIFGGLLKLVGFRGYFYKIAGHNINAIDGFNPVSKPPMNEYAVLPPENGDDIANELEEKFDTQVVILDGNNIDNNVLGIGEVASAYYTIEDIMQIAKGNPQGQEDDGVRTPFLIIRPQ